MLCLTGCTVGKMNGHTHSTSSSLTVRCPRWQRWAPSLVWLSLVWFLLQSQPGPARPCSWFTSFGFPSFPNIISLSHLFILLPAEMLSQMGRFFSKQVTVLILCCDIMESTLAQARCTWPKWTKFATVTWEMFGVYCFLSDVLYVIYIVLEGADLTYCGLHQRLIWKLWYCMSPGF